MKANVGAIRLWIGSWILIGLLVASLNGYALLALIDDPLAGYSAGARQVDREIMQFRRFVAEKKEKKRSDMDQLAKRYANTPDPVPASRKVASQRVAPEPTVSLPTVAGILTRRAIDGTLQRVALLNGSVFSVGDQVDGLTVKAISPGGVLLSRGKKSWFIKSPATPYSLTVQ